MTRTSPRLAALIAISACLLPAAGVRAAARPGPSGQFQPTRTDRDGDGVADASDCAPDDPTRPARTGSDANCDGTPDGTQQAASTPSVVPSARGVARRAAGVPVVALGVRLGSAVSVFAPRAARARAPALVFVARDNCAVSVRPVLVFAGGRTRALPARQRSVPRGHAYVVRLHLSRAQARALRVRFAMTVIDAAGGRHGASRAVRVAG
jgi:hypothetical protein